MITETVMQMIYNRPAAPGYYHIGFEGGGDAYADAVPGQFVMVRTTDTIPPLLRRPFSIHRLLRRSGAVVGIELLVKVVGPATRLVTSLAAGAGVHVMGPLGRGFRLSTVERRIDMVAGGVGVAPVVFLAEHLLDKGLSPDRLAVYIGGRTRQELLCAEDFRSLGLRVVETTDDGSAGDQCLVTHPLEEAVSDDPPDAICACGPMAMLACVAGIAERHHVPCQVSIETMMACGLGACLGCAVKPRDAGRGYLHACLHGPVFDAQALNW